MIGRTQSNDLPAPAKASMSLSINLVYAQGVVGPEQVPNTGLLAMNRVIKPQDL